MMDTQYKEMLYVKWQIISRYLAQKSLPKKFKIFLFAKKSEKMRELEKKICEYTYKILK